MFSEAISFYVFFMYVYILNLDDLQHNAKSLLLSNFCCERREIPNAAKELRWIFYKENSSLVVIVCFMSRSAFAQV